MGERTSILVVEDDTSVGPTIVRQLAQAGYDAELTTRAKKALEAVEEGSYDCVLSDIRMPEMDGMELLKKLKARDPALPVIMLTAFATTELTVDAMRIGATDFLEKPYERGRLIEAITMATELSAKAQASPPATPRLGGIVGESRAIVECLRRVDRAARTEEAVLVTGESGTGKELVARAIHERSRRKDKPFVAVSCAAIPEHLLESELFGSVRGAFTDASNRPGRVTLAEGGTLFLDEIGDLPLPAQVKLLRLIQEKSYEPLGSSRTTQADVRFVAATHRDLKKLVEEEAFRGDLSYRLNVLGVHLPPLREREGDVALLARHFLEEVATENGRPNMRFADEAVEALARHPFPGNVRELSTVVRRLVVFCDDDLITAADVARELDCEVLNAGSDPEDLADALKKAELDLRRRYLQRALDLSGGNKKRAAELLGIARRTIHNWTVELELGDED